MPGGDVGGGGGRRRSGGRRRRAPRAGTGSCRRLRGTAVALALGGPVQELAVDNASQRGSPPLTLARRRCVRLLWLLQVHQVVVRLAHARVLALVPPAEEQLGTLVQEAACGQEPAAESQHSTTLLTHEGLCLRLHKHS